MYRFHQPASYPWQRKKKLLRISALLGDEGSVGTVQPWWVGVVRYKYLIQPSAHRHKHVRAY